MGIRLSHLPKEVQERILRETKRRPKYGNTKVTVDGHTFDSKLEASVWALLKQDMAAGKITTIERQPRIALSKAEIGFRPDFRVTYPDGTTALVEAKGKETKDYRIKLRLFVAYGAERLRIFKGSARRPAEVECVVPKALQ